MIEESLKRPFTTYPHVGRTIVTDDFMTITDAWHTGDAYLHVLQTGSTWANDCGTAWNAGTEAAPTSIPLLQNTNAYMLHEGISSMSGIQSNVTGVPAGYRFITQGFVSNYAAYYGGEINSQHDSFALALDFRFLSELEFGGVGAKGQRLRVYLYEESNPASVQIQVLTDIFFDYQWYAANVSPIVPVLPPFGAPNPQNVIDLAQQTTSFAQSGEINIGLIIDKIKASLRKSGSGAAHIWANYELPKGPTGAGWNQSTNPFFALGLASVTHPLSGVDTQSWGLLDVTFTTFRSTTYTAPTGGAIGANGRIQTAFPTTADPRIGENLGVGIFNQLFQKGRASAGVSWPSVYLGLRNFGGTPRPAVGNVAFPVGFISPSYVFAVVDTATETKTLNIQIPNGATRFTVYAQIRLTAGTGGHVVTADLEKNLTGGPLIWTQNLMARTYAGNAATQWVWIDLPLSANMQTVSGQVERAKLTLASTKPSPRVGANQTAAGFWDGIGSFYLAFR